MKDDLEMATNALCRIQELKQFQKIRYTNYKKIMIRLCLMTLLSGLVYIYLKSAI